MDNLEKELAKKQRNYQIVKSNDIIQKARYDLSISELKALAYIFSKIRPTDKYLQEYSFSIKEYCLVCGIDYKNGGNYRYIKQTIKGIRDKSFWVEDEKGNECLIGWLQKARINEGNGTITVKLDEDLQKYVIGLFKNFTSYDLLSTLPFTSKFSFRIYELLKSYAFTTQYTFYIDELKRKLAAEHYKNFNDFKRFVLDIATKEINEYTDLEISWETQKKGRKVIAVIFKIKQRDSWGKYSAYKNATNKIDGQIDIFEYQKELEDE